MRRNWRGSDSRGERSFGSILVTASQNAVSFSPALVPSRLPLAALTLAVVLAHPRLWAHEPEPVILDNGPIRLGVDKSSGAAVFFFGESKSGRNLLNRYDRGRFVQQSFYGRPDGTHWNGKPWRWNPVQGGNWEGRPSKVESLEATKTTLHARTIPHHWAGDSLIEEVRMEQWIELEGKIARLRFRFDFTGDDEHPARHQELPAVFLDARLSHLVYYDGDAPWSGDAITRRIPGWPNQYVRSTENWAAFVDDKDRGCGLYFPGTTELTTYRHPGPSGEKGAGCSYFAPIRTLQVKGGFRLDYTVYLTLGSVDEIRQRFAALRKNEEARAESAK